MEFIGRDENNFNQPMIKDRGRLESWWQTQSVDWL